MARFLVRLGKTASQSSVYLDGTHIPNLKSVSIGVAEGDSSPIMKIEIKIEPGSLDIENNDVALVSTVADLQEFIKGFSKQAQRLFADLDREIQ